MLVRDDEGLMPKERDVGFKEEENLIEECLVEVKNVGYDMEDTNSIQGNFTDFFEALNFLEEKLESQRVHILYVKLKLEEEEISLEDNNEEEFARYE